MTLEWRRDKAGDALWDGETFLGCIYDRDGLASRARRHGWRALAGEDMIPIGDTLPTEEQPDARLGARALLEAHVGYTRPLPTAQQLLELTNQETPCPTRRSSSTPPSGTSTAPTSTSTACRCCEPEL